MYINRVKVKESMANIGISTQSQLAALLGITKNQMSVILSEKYTPYKSTFKDLCTTLNVTPDMILETTASYHTDHISCKVEPTEITALELFAGGGGLALGLEQACIKTLAHIEIDKYCCETLKKNRPNWNVINDDIRNINFQAYRHKIDIVTGGFPCQAFSYAGKKLGFEDTRGTLFYEFARCLKEVEPLAFMAENVRGLISHDDGRTLDTIINIFEELNYTVEYKLLNAYDYGVPQKRERVAIIGTKKGINFTYPTKTLIKRTLAHALKAVPVSPGQKYSPAKKAVLDLIPPGGCWRNLPEDIQRTYMGKSFESTGGRTGMARRIAWDEPCLTLTCSPSQKQTERCHPDETRPFTVREYARIQTFPDDWLFSGGLGEQYKQIGNAVPISLAKQLGRQLRTATQEYKTCLVSKHD